LEVLSFQQLYSSASGLCCRPGPGWLTRSLEFGSSKFIVYLIPRTDLVVPI
jgi:hypothetical protein